MERPDLPPRDDQPICHFCIRPQEDVPLLFVTEDEVEGDNLSDRPNICSECVALVQIAIAEKGAEAAAVRRAAVRRRRFRIMKPGQEGPH